MTTSAATPWALLGDITFQVDEAPTRLDATERTRFIKIPRIEQKPSQQWPGDELRSLRLGFRFAAAWCDPEQQLRRLQDARLAHGPMGLTMGGGEFRGYYLIEQIQVRVRHTDADSNLLAIEVTVTLTETTDKPEQDAPKKVPFQKRVA